MTDCPALLTKLEEQKTDLLAQVAGWPPARLNFHPGSQEWSALEMFDHLVRTEEAILNAARQGVAKPHRLGVADRVRTRFLESVFRSERRVKVPASASQVLPGSDLELSSIVRRWQESRLELEGFTQSLPEELQTAGLFKHPVGGWMAMPDILTFFSVHIVHHGYQMARLREVSLASVSDGR